MNQDSKLDGCLALAFGALMRWQVKASARAPVSSRTGWGARSHLPDMHVAASKLRFLPGCWTAPSVLLQSSPPTWHWLPPSRWSESQGKRVGDGSHVLLGIWVQESHSVPPVTLSYDKWVPVRRPYPREGSQQTVTLGGLREASSHRFLPWTLGFLVKRGSGPFSAFLIPTPQLGSPSQLNPHSSAGPHVQRLKESPESSCNWPPSFQSNLCLLPYFSKLPFFKISIFYFWGLKENAVLLCLLQAPGKKSGVPNA